LTPEQEDRLRARLQGLAGLRQVYEVIQDLAALQETARFALPFFVLRSLLQDLAWRVEGLPQSDQIIRVWATVQQTLVPAMLRVFDHYPTENREAMFAEMDILAKQWAILREELR
jgi:hypothetical protein